MRDIAVVLVCAALLRIGWAVAIPMEPVSDSRAYEVFARNIASGVGFSWVPGELTAYWPVGTPAIYAALHWTFGPGYTPAVVAHVIAGISIVALAMVLARRWFDGRTARATGWILACWPVLIQFTTILASELFFCAFLLLAFWIGSSRAGTRAPGAIAAGTALAAAAYVRPHALAMAPLLYLRTWIGERRAVAALRAIALAAAAMLVCILPWSVRNWLVFERVVPISTNAGTNLWMGNNPSGSIEYQPLPPIDIRNEADRDRYFAAEARRHIAADPVDFFRRAAKKLLRTHDRETIGVEWNAAGIAETLGNAALTPLKWLSSLYWWVVLGLALYGLIALIRGSGARALLACPAAAAWAYFALVHAVTVAGDRYHIPSNPFIAMLAAYGWSRRSDICKNLH